MDNLVTLKIIVDDKEGVTKLPVDTKLVNNLTKEIQQLEVQQKRTTGSSSNMNMAIMQMGYGIGDLSMITTNWRFALMGIGNNLPFVTQGIMAAKQEAKGLGVTFGQLAMQSIRGPGGILLAVNAVILAFQILPSLFGESTKAIREQKDEVDKLRDSYSKLTREQLQAELAKAQLRLSAEMFNVPDVLRRRIAMGDAPPTEEMKRLQGQVDIIKKAIYMLGDIENIENRLTINRQRLKDLNNENLELYKDIGSTYDEVKGKLEGWILADQKLLKSGKERVIVEKEIYSLQSKSNAAFLQQRASGVYQNTNEAFSPYGPASTGGAGQAITTVKRLIDYNEIYNDSLKQSAQNVGDVVSQWTLVRLGLGQANSLAQIFLATMIQVASQRIVTSLIETALSGGGNFISDLFGSIFGAADGAIVTKPTFMMVGEGKEPEGVFPLSWLHNNMLNNKAQPIIVNLQGEAEVGLTKLHFKLKKLENMINEKY